MMVFKNQRYNEFRFSFRKFTTIQWLSKRLDSEKRPPTDIAFDPTTLHIPSGGLLNFKLGFLLKVVRIDFAKLSDMMKQYWEYKRNHMNELVFLQWVKS